MSAPSAPGRSIRWWALAQWGVAAAAAAAAWTSRISSSRRCRAASCSALVPPRWTSTASTSSAMQPWSGAQCCGGGGGNVSLVELTAGFCLHRYPLDAPVQLLTLLHPHSVCLSCTYPHHPPIYPPISASLQAVSARHGGRAE